MKKQPVHTGELAGSQLQMGDMLNIYVLHNYVHLISRRIIQSNLQSASNSLEMILFKLESNFLVLEVRHV